MLLKTNALKLKQAINNLYFTTQKKVLVLFITIQ